jgi:hypothetical protein
MKLAVVQAWHEALAAADPEALLATTSEDVAIYGPRGVAHGHDVLRGWAAQAGVGLEPERWFCGADDEVVVLQRATWPGEEGGRTEGTAVATAFTVRDARIRRIARHDTLAAALTDAGLAEDDEAHGGG